MVSCDNTVTGDTPVATADFVIDPRNFHCANRHHKQAHRRRVPLLASLEGEKTGQSVCKQMLPQS